MNGERLAAAAEELVGARFRLHGRDPASGLDCIGVLAAALATIGRPASLPDGYRLRSHRLGGVEASAKACGFTTAGGAIEAGDVLLVRAAPCQFHLIIAGRGDRFVHAHAGLRRVVAAKGAPPWPIINHWRLASPA